MKRNDTSAQTYLTTAPRLDMALRAVLGLLCLGAVLSFVFVDEGLAQWIYGRKLSWPSHLYDLTIDIAWIS